MTKAPYIVYTPDKDFVLEKDDISGGGGSGGGVFIIESEVANNKITLKKTWKEIKDAFISGKSCIVIDSSLVDIINRYLVISVTDYTVNVILSDGVTSFTADSENDYPIYTIK